MGTEHTKNYRPQNECPVHGTKLITKHYSEDDKNKAGDNLDLLITKCREKTCLEGHGMVENFKARRDRKKKVWLEKNAQKVVEDAVVEIESEVLEEVRK